MTTDFRALLPEPTPRAARAVALDLLDALDAQHSRLDAPNDVEALHDFRVALRRLRSWLRAYKKDVRDTVGKKTMRVLGVIGRVTTASRDIEVQLEWLAAQQQELTAQERVAAKWLKARLTEEQMRADAASREEIGRSFAETSAKLRKNLSRYAVAVLDQSGTERWATRAADRVQDAFLAFRRQLATLEDAHNDERLHRVRIAGKRLRYLIEPLHGVVAGATDAVDRMKVIQDALGAMHDAHVLAKDVRRHARSAPPARGRARSGEVTGGLRSIERRLKRLRIEAWEAQAEPWLEHDFARLGDHVHAVIADLREVGGEGVEIERKYLLRKLPPETKRAPVMEIEQGYLPGSKLIERLRRVTSGDSVHHYRTVKSGTGLVRTELEDETSAAIFKQMWPLTKGKRLRKRRYKLADAGRVWEIDEFLGRKLVMAEVELSSARDDVAIPDWLARCVVREVTGEPEYLNHNLAE